MFWLQKRCLCCFVLCSILYRFSSAQGFNSLLFQPIDANVTCGTPAEIYFRTQDGVLHPRLRTPLVCDATDSANSHPPEKMVDDDLTTFWQSKASIDRADIRIDLNQEVYGYELFMTFGDYRRPEQIAFYKSKDFGATFEPWHFLVSAPAVEQCRDVFNMPVTFNPEKVNTVICQQYPSYFPMEYNETFSVDMNGRQRGDGSSASDYHSPEILDWMKITNLKIVFTGLYKKFDRLSTAWHHYTVREVGISAKCNCNGFADGFNCPLDSVTKRRECRCQGNTCGSHCQQCCPAYNQHPWQPSNGAPWMWNGTASCEACNCHNHSDVCVYDQNVADRKLSLDTEGRYSGGGVCVDCKHNTDGINCEKCKTNFYRPVSQSKTSFDSCKECGCNPAGTIAHPNMTYLDCVRDEDTAKLHSGKIPGDCYCKENVLGRTCDTCKDGFYHLTENNSLGCQGCDCFLPGTLNRSNICEKDTVGQCPCKENTHSRNCAQCKPGYYNLRNEDVDGCEDCGCDPGGSVQGSFCNNITGTCECRAHIYGKQCERFVHIITVIKYSSPIA
ncbi:laminin subunit beta-1-like [Dendronephthya gigantea]|uniref:laminin subunit beta-1-like n=1 Tax=Dendronephthya gigantea TaxID=151771 RepID=UPI00106B313C|nr:laminin subunit beta-1-like [Dendronephthya gigantea]